MRQDPFVYIDIASMGEVIKSGIGNAGKFSAIRMFGLIGICYCMNQTYLLPRFCSVTNAF